MHFADIQILPMTLQCQRHCKHDSYILVHADFCVLCGAEHLAAVEIMQLKHIIILQNKIDLIDETKAVTQQDAIQVCFCRPPAAARHHADPEQFFFRTHCCTLTM